jgi:hypothetical protein
MKKITITLSDEEYTKLEALADVLNLSPCEYIERVGIEFMTDSVCGDVAENVASRYYDTLEEATRATAKAEALDGFKSKWRYYRTPEGRILAITAGLDSDGNSSEGCTLIEEVAA